MNIGELWLKIGVKEEASLKKAIKNLSKIGETAQESISKLGSAARSMSADWAKLGNVTTRLNADIARSARQTAASVIGSVNRQRNAIGSLTTSLEREARALGDVAAAERKVAAARSANMSRRAVNQSAPNFAKLIGKGGGGDINWATAGLPPKRTRSEGDMALELMSDDLAAGGRSSGTVNLRRQGVGGQSGASVADNISNKTAAARRRNMARRAANQIAPNFANLIGKGGGDDIVDWGGLGAKKTPKGPGFIGRFRNALSSGGGGGGAKRRGRGGGGGGGGFGGRGERFGPLGEASSFRRVLMGAGIFQGAREFGQLSDTYARLQMRIEGVTSTQAEANATFERLRQIAKNTRIGLEDTAEGYVRIRHATAEMKLSSDDTFKLVENINTLLATSGASTQEAASGMRQLTQAFSKGKLDGDEFKAIAENMPNVMKVLQKSLGVTEGRLRDMSEAGELTRNRLVKALLNVKGLQKPIDTFGSTWQQFKDDLMISFGVFTKENDLVADFKVVLQKLADVIVNYLLPAFAKFVKALKEGRYWAYALVGIITGSLILSFLKLAAAPFITIANGIWKIVKALRALKAAQAGAAAANVANGLGGAAGGAAAGNAAKGATKGGMLRTAGGLLAALLPRAILPAGIAAGVTYGVDKLGIRGKGSLDEGGWMDMVRKGQTPDVLRDFVGYRDPSSASSIAGNTTNIGNIDIKIEASDMADVESKMTKELMDRMMRQANPYAAGR